MHAILCEINRVIALLRPDRKWACQQQKSRMLISIAGIARYRLYAICRIDSSVIWHAFISFSSAVATECRDGWSQFQTSCYKVYTEGKARHAAKKTCTNEGRYQGKNIHASQAPGDFAPEMHKKGPQKWKRAPENCIDCNLKDCLMLQI